MERDNSLALIVAYYLSRFDRIAYRYLGFDTLAGGHEAVGLRLGVNPNTVKNMRDEFDSIHDNPRVGWHQREILPSRRRVVDAFEDLEEFEVRAIVEEILSHGPDGEYAGLESILVELTGDENQELKEDTSYIVRGSAGRRAEEAFIKFYKQRQLPVSGELIDVRDFGCGYDFEIRNAKMVMFVEVKGLISELGGMLFTSKEWEKACDLKEGYVVALVRNLAAEPSVELIRNPAESFHPIKYIRQTVQIRYQVREDEVREVIKND